MKIYQSNDTWGALDQYTFWISSKGGTSWCKASVTRDHNSKAFPDNWCDNMKATPKIYDDQQNVLENE
jgi:hypothetical protein